MQPMGSTKVCILKSSNLEMVTLLVQKILIMEGLIYAFFNGPNIRLLGGARWVL